MISTKQVVKIFLEKNASSGLVKHNQGICET